MTLETRVASDPATGRGDFTIELPGRPAYASTARMFVSSIARHFGCSQHDVDDLKLAISEVFGIATRGAGASHSLRVTVHADDRGLDVILEHPSGFDALVDRGAGDAETELGLAVIESLFPDVVFASTPSGARAEFRLAL